MDINKTGNVFLAYPEEGMTPDAWDYGKLQNKDALVNLLVGFSISNPVEYDLNKEAMDAVIEWTAITEADLAACESVADIDRYLSGFTLEKDTDLSTLTAIEKKLLAYNGITDSSASRQVKGVLALMRADEKLTLMYDATYDPNDPYAGDETGNTKNKDHYGPGGSLHQLYRKWAVNMEFLIEEE